MNRTDISSRLEEIITAGRSAYTLAPDDPMAAIVAMGNMIFDLMALKAKLEE